MCDARSRILDASSAINRRGKERLFLQLRKLRPGDIMLTTSFHWASNMIARFTGGPYSHVALVTTPISLFESRNDGVGYTLLKDCWIGDCDALEVNLGRCSRAVVLRHSSLLDHSDDELVAITDKIKKRIDLCDYHGRAYPQTSTLLETIEIPGALRVVIGFWLDGVDKLRGHHPLESVAGPFCSQLVADILNSLDCLCAESDSTNLIANPNTFLNSKFIPVEGAVLGKIGPACRTIENGRKYVEGLSLVRDVMERIKLTFLK